MPELLVELLSEEIPARMQARAAADLKRLCATAFDEAQLPCDRIDTYVTPRRLALVAHGLPESQPDTREERRGPKVGAPDQAIQGFLRSNGLAMEDLEERDTPKGRFFFAVIERKGASTADVLVDVIHKAVNQLAWAKSMRWGAHGFRWVRPLHSLLAQWNGKNLDMGLPLSGGGDLAVLASANHTVGHRFLAPAPISVTGFADYRAKLRDAKVMLDQDERRAGILEQAERLAAAEGLSLRDDPGLLDEVTGLVEWPVAVMGRIDDAFMDVPQEVLITSMRTHQKFFSLLDGEGRMASRFIAIANTEAADGGREVVAGNERVLRARLSDAKFFWDQDRKKRLEARAPDVAAIAFYQGLGTMADKTERMAGLARELASRVGADPDLAERAARLAKADLTTEMVYEFPELQGIMGQHYALNDGEPAEVAEAIADHYAPQGPNDRCPTDPVSVAVALADKIDTLVGFFAIDEKPTGSKDPFALRRAALGVIRLVIENTLRLPLGDMFVRAHALFGGTSMASADTVANDLLDFFADRLKVHLREQGVRHDLITAVFAPGGEDDLVRLLARVDALQRFLGTDDGANLLTAYKRASNIIRIEEKRDGRSYDGEVEPGRLVENPERDLYERLTAAHPRIAEDLQHERFGDAMGVLAGLRSPVDVFFDEVTVNCDEPDLRANRLRLLSHIRSALGGVADFSRIEG